MLCVYWSILVDLLRFIFSYRDVFEQLCFYLFQFCIVLQGLGHPRVHSHFFNRDPLSWVSHQDSSDEVLCLLRDDIPSFNFKIIRAGFNLFKKFKVIFLIERWSSSEKNKCYNTNTPNITLFTIWFLLEHFWGDIAGGTTCCTRH